MKWSGGNEWDCGGWVWFFPPFPSDFLLFHFLLFILWSFISLLLVMPCVRYFSLSFFVIIQFASRCTLFKEEMKMKMRMKLQNHGWGVLMTYRTWPPSPSPLFLLIFPLF